MRLDGPPVTSGVTITPASGKHWKSVSLAAMSLISGAAPHYSIPAGTPGLDVDEYGVVRMGPNVLGPTGAPSTWDMQQSVPDFMWDQSSLRVYSRTFYAQEIGDPPEFTLTRWGPNNSYPYNDSDRTHLTGLDIYDTIGIFGWQPAVAPFGGDQTTPGAKTYGRSAVWIAKTAEKPRLTAADGSMKAMGTHMVAGTTPLGTSGIVNRFAITSEGVVGTLGAGFDYDNLHALSLSQGDFYVRGKLYANANASVTGTLTTSGLATVNSLTVTNLATLNGGLTLASGNLTVSSGNIQLPSTATLAIGGGSAYFSRPAANTLQANGGFNVVGAFAHQGTTLGAFNTTPTTKQTVTGSRGANAALASLLTALAAYGLVTDSSTA